MPYPYRPQLVTAQLLDVAHNRTLPWYHSARLTIAMSKSLTKVAIVWFTFFFDAHIISFISQGIVIAIDLSQQSDNLEIPLNMDGLEHAA